MILRIARKEFLEMTRDGRFRWSAGIVFVLLGTSLLMGWRHYAEMSRQIAAAKDQQRELWLNLPARNPHSAAHRGIYVFKPLMPLSAIDEGIDAYTGVSFLLEAHDQNLSQNKPAEDDLAVARFGATTGAATLQILLPLLIVLLVFPSFAAEREQGTLRHLLSLGVPRRDLAWGKALGAVAPLALLLIPAAVLGAIAMWLNTTGAIAAMTLPRAAVMILAYLLYFAVFVGFSLIVSAKAPTSRYALLVLLAFWFVNSLVAPRLAAGIAHHAIPTPGTAEFLRAIEEEKREVAKGWREKTIAAALARYGVRRVEDLPYSLSGIFLIEGDKRDSAIYERAFGRVFDVYERQSSVYAAQAVAASSLAIQTLSMGLAGTDVHEQRHFLEAVGEYRKEWLRVLNEDVLVHQKRGQVVYTRGRDLWEQAPQFEYRAPGLGWVLRRQKLSIAMLLIWFGAVSVLTPLTLRRIRTE